jgi:hypothetical protein
MYGCFPTVAAKAKKLLSVSPYDCMETILKLWMAGLRPREPLYRHKRVITPAGVITPACDERSNALASLNGALGSRVRYLS